MALSFLSTIIRASFPERNLCYNKWKKVGAVRVEIFYFLMGAFFLYAIIYMGVKHGINDSVIGQVAKKKSKKRPKPISNAQIEKELEKELENDWKA